MEFVKKIKLVIVIVLVILALVIIRSSGVYHFKNDAKKWAEISMKQSNKLTINEARALPGNHLIISLDTSNSGNDRLSGDIKNIPAKSILDKKNIRLIMGHDGPVLLSSSDPGVAARIWMILSQMGRKNIYIVTSDSDNEVLKYKFHPDTSGTTF
jgi:hypothetical protein